MSEIETTTQEAPPKKPWWQQLERGQALIEYWPTLPAAVMVMIAASAITGPIGHIFQRTADALNLETCGTAPPAYFTLPIGQVVEIIGSDYDSKHDRSTFTISVPGDSDVVLGFSEADVERISQSSENFGDFEQDPETGKWGIKSDADSGGGSPVSTSDAREITLTLTGEVDFVNNLEVTIVDDGVVSSGFIYTTVTYTGEDCANQSSKTWGNNGVGNGFDDQPPGQPPENDTCEGAAPGSPCNVGGVNNDNGNGGGNDGNNGNNGNNGNSV